MGKIYHCCGITGYCKTVTTCDCCGTEICAKQARLKLVNKKNDVVVYHNLCLPKKERRPTKEE